MVARDGIEPPTPAFSGLALDKGKVRREKSYGPILCTIKDAIANIARFAISNPEQRRQNTCVHGSRARICRLARNSMLLKKGAWDC